MVLCNLEDIDVNNVNNMIATEKEKEEKCFISYRYIFGENVL